MPEPEEDEAQQQIHPCQGRFNQQMEKYIYSKKEWEMRHNFKMYAKPKRAQHNSISLPPSPPGWRQSSGNCASYQSRHSRTALAIFRPSVPVPRFVVA